MSDSGTKESEIGAHRAGLYLHPDAYGYDFGSVHPMQPMRLRALADLIDSLGLICVNAERREHAPATDEQLRVAHSARYIQAVRTLARQETDDRDRRELQSAFGLGVGDTPAFAGMHAASAAIAGSTVAAIAAVLSGDLDHAFSPAGGLHHAMRERASGFCVYNDVVVGIKGGLLQREARVLYVDFDAHHGDGVQAAFYESPRVLTVSLHESGRYLFPGTGETHETGSGDGAGFSLNVPVQPFTQDESWLEIVRVLLPALCEDFRPDLIVTQHGLDGHIWDPLTHLALTNTAFAEQTALVHRLAHEWCQGRWVACGGGGYQPLLVVPRAWTALWSEMTGHSLPDRLPEQWLARWATHSSEPIPETFSDPDEAGTAMPRAPEIAAENRGAAAAALDALRAARAGQV